MRVALTGGIASGKSTVSRMLAELGAIVIDSDALAREVVEPGTPGLAAVVEAFGPEILTEDGTLDRPAMGALVFADKDKRRVLEGILHPLIGERSAALAAAAGPDDLVVHDIPLLAEAGIADTFDAVIVVDAPAEVQVERMLRDRGWTREDAEARIAAQATREDRLAIATYVIDNTGSMEDLRARVEEVYAELTAPVADEVRAALEVALRDFQHPTEVALQLDVGRVDGNDLVWVTAPDGSRSGLWVQGSDTEAELLVRAADYLQDQVFDQLEETWGEARPPCPGHQHPADPALVEGQAWWVCPRSREPLGRIGELC